MEVVWHLGYQRVIDLGRTHVVDGPRVEGLVELPVPLLITFLDCLPIDRGVMRWTDGNDVPFMGSRESSDVDTCIDCIAPCLQAL